MRVLVACEYSGTVRDAFRALGHSAYSVDILPTERESLDSLGLPTHFTRDALSMLDAHVWDLLIAHPPCTYLCHSGVRWLHERPERWGQMAEAVIFFREFLTSKINRVAVENPVMSGYAAEWVGVPYTQTLQPWHHGDEAFKRTALWLKNLPPLTDTNRLVPPAKGTDEHKRWSACHRAAPSPNRARIRSRTYSGIAAAMAAQWGCL